MHLREREIVKDIILLVPFCCIYGSSAHGTARYIFDWHYKDNTGTGTGVPRCEYARDARDQRCQKTCGRRTDSYGFLLVGMLLTEEEGLGPSLEPKSAKTKLH